MIDHQKVLDDIVDQCETLLASGSVQQSGRHKFFEQISDALMRNSPFMNREEHEYVMNMFAENTKIVIKVDGIDTKRYADVVSRCLISIYDTYGVKSWQLKECILNCVLELT